MYIFHITELSTWLQSISNGAYIPLNFNNDGFIHCSNRDQVLNTADHYYQNSKDLVLLQIDVSKLASKLVIENLEGGIEQFPHIYGPLNLEAVSATSSFQKNDKGEFIFPFS